MPPEIEKSRLILVAMDCSKPAEAALDAAINIAKCNQDRIMIVHIYSYLAAPLPYPQFLPTLNLNPPPPSTPDSVIAEMQPCLRGYEKRATDAGIKSVESRLISTWGTTGEGIVAEADRIGVSLIVIGSRGLTGIKRTLLGSVADYVVKNAHCDVYIAKGNVER